MDFQEQTLLRGALQAAKSLAIYGMNAPEIDVLQNIESEKGKFTTWDLRATSESDLKQLRSEAKKHLKKHTNMVVLLSGNPNNTIRDLLNELYERRLKINEEEPEKLNDDACIIGIINDQQPNEETLKCFNLRLGGLSIITESRQVQQQVEDNLRAAQERARQSSIQHGLVD